MASKRWSEANEDKAVQEYQNSTDERLVNFARDVKGGVFTDPSRQNYPLGKASEREVADIGNLTGINVDGFSHNMNGSSVEHIDNRHGANGVADHSMADINDLGRIRYVLDNYDKVDLLYDDNGDAVYSNHFKDSNNKPSPVVVYEKRINGIYYVVEAVPDSKMKKLQVVSVYKAKAKSGGGQELGVRSPQAHVRNELAATANNKITHSN
jgi:hypothetical protein